MKKYRFGFEPWGLLLFLVVMLPNLIWFAVPAPNDILREGPAGGFVDSAASVFQILMAAALCLLVNRERGPLADAADFCRRGLRPALLCRMGLVLYGIYRSAGNCAADTAAVPGFRVLCL